MESVFPQRVGIPLATLVALACGCGDAAVEVDAGAGDSGVDAGTLDAGSTDAGACDYRDFLGGLCESSEQCECDTVCELGACATPTACDEALLSWDGPIENEDGSCLVDLAGFRAYWSADEELPSEYLEVGLDFCINADVVPCGTMGETVQQIRCALRLPDLPEGDLYFWVTSISETGVESVPPAPAMKTISCP